MVKRENVEKWIAALRSGKFNQIEGHLGDDNGHCCLGVACEVAIANGVRTKRRRSGGEGGLFTYSDHRDTMPKAVQQWLGITQGDGNPDLGDSSCAQLNDEGVMFEDIADLIETKYLATSTQEISG